MDVGSFSKRREREEMPIRAYRGVVRIKQNMFCVHETTAIYCGQGPKGVHGVSMKECRTLSRTDDDSNPIIILKIATEINEANK